MERVKRYTYKVEINGKDATTDLLPYLLSLVINDVTDGQDTAELVIDNRYLSWHKTRPIKRGDKVVIFLGIDGYMERLFGGMVNTIRYSLNKSSRLTVGCTSIDMASPGIRAPSSDSFSNSKPDDIIDDLVKKYGFDFSRLSPTDILTKSGNYPNFAEADLIRAKRIANEKLGATLGYKDGKAKLFDNKVGREISYKFTWGKNNEIVGVNIGESREEEPVDEIESTLTNPLPNSKGSNYEDDIETIGSLSHDEILSPSPLSIVVTKLKGIHDQAPEQKSDTQTKINSLHKKIGKYLVSGDIQLSGAPPVRAGKWLSIDNIGEYSGQYYIDRVSHQAASDYSQNISICSHIKK